MKVSDLIKEFNLEIFAGEQNINNEITDGYTSDLLSDVMGFAKEGDIWVTLQNHKNVVAIASLKDISAIVLVKGIKPEKETIEHANNEGIPLLGTNETTFSISGKIYKTLNK